MSFSSKVKKELINVPCEARHCMIAEIGAIILMTGQIKVQNGKYMLKIQAENEDIARKYFTMIRKAFNINKEVLFETDEKKKKKIYSIVVNEDEMVRKILLATTILKSQGTSEEIRNYMDQVIVQSICCKRAYLRAIFLAAGSVSDPKKGYHLEVTLPTLEQAEYLKGIMQTLEIDAKIVSRKGSFVIYLKEGAQIVDLLNVMGAHIALMEFENVRIVKEVRNNVNRLVNCETANLKKTVAASVRQIQDIEYLQREIGLSNLPPNLQEMAIYRLEHSNATLKELGELFNPPVGKSGVNHRLKKLSQLAEKTREQRGGIIRND